MTVKGYGAYIVQWSQIVASLPGIHPNVCRAGGGGGGGAGNEASQIGRGFLGSGE